MHCHKVSVSKINYSCKEKGNHTDVQVSLHINIHTYSCNARNLFIASVIVVVRLTYPPVISSHVSTKLKDSDETLAKLY